MKRFLTLAVLLTGLMLSTGCDQKAIISRLTPPAEDKMAREFLDAIRRGADDEAWKFVDAKLQTAEGKRGLRDLEAYFQDGVVKGIEVIGVNTNTFYTVGKTRASTTLNYEVELTTGWLAGTIVIEEEAGHRSITTARFNKYPASLEYLTRFTFQGKQPIHYLFFALGIAIPVFSIFALVTCVRTKLKRKWLWVIFILLGFVTFRLDWTNGQTDYQLLAFQLLGASAFKMGPGASWILSVSIPLGALVFLIKRKGLMAATLVENATNQSPEPPQTAAH
jgi:hypothetical protein